MDNLEKLHKSLLLIANEIKRVCDKNDINYFLIAGSCLGAIRHKGFIPWDDDMDFGFLRSEYDRFIEACKTDLSDEFYLETWDTDKNCPYSYAKIKLNGTSMTEIDFASKNVKVHKGIFIDIFPFDNVPVSEKARYKQGKKFRRLTRILRMKKGMQGDFKSKHRLVYTALRFLTFFVNYNHTKKKCKRVQQKYNGVESGYVVTPGRYGYTKETLKKEWFSEYELVMFEGIEFKTFKAWDEYLTYFYGDYMKLPPEDKRVVHMAPDINFGSYFKED